uniref:RNA ligase n=1 Tax=Mimivirus LCMiAC02 TaxID=2506609 RepID=A0A4D5XEV7_9VIRU|nr:MAG: uncharacterized protein LCMiAC02_03750 [Mimivirus LCMiAC02]
METFNLTNGNPINELITNLSMVKSSTKSTEGPIEGSGDKPTQVAVTYDELKQELLQKVDGNPIYYVNIKENDELAMIYYDDIPKNNGNRESFSKFIESSCKSHIIEKSTLKTLASQFNKIIYNKEATEYLKTKDWKQVVVQPCYEGTLLLVYNHRDTWYVSTRRCINAKDSIWIKNTSYRDMFDEAMENKFKLEDLDKNNCYHFILVHHKNKNIVSYSNLGEEYTELYHIMTTAKYTMEEVDYVINNNILRSKTLKFDSLKEVMQSLVEISVNNKNNKNITTEGYILKVYDGDVNKSTFKILKIQTPIYQELMKIKPNNNNAYQNYLELYQKDKLINYLQYYTKKYVDEILNIIHHAMETISKEILDLYHMTRKKRNPQIYNNLTYHYKKILYELHGMYIEFHKNNFRDKNKKYKKNNNQYENNAKSINVHDVYYHLKGLHSNELKQLFMERNKLQNNTVMTFIDSDGNDSTDAAILSELMNS